MHSILKEIHRNLKRHRGTAAWQEPQREPEKGEIRGFRWEFPNGRQLTLLLDPAVGQIQVTKAAPDLTEADGPASYTLASNELEAMRALYRWVAGAE